VSGEKTRRSQSRTDVDRLDLDALLDVRGLCVVGELVGEDIRLAQRVDKRRASGAARAWACELGKREKRAGDVPTTMSVNWTPFFTLLRPRCRWDMVDEDGGVVGGRNRLLQRFNRVGLSAN
jgi:hypothetical protein